MRLRIGKWIELALHFGSPDRVSSLPDRYLVHAVVRCGTSQWHHGPVCTAPAAQHFVASNPRTQPHLSFYTESESMAPGFLWR